MKHHIFNSFWGIYFTLCLMAFIWPIAGIANKIEPTIGGLPFFFAWYILWVLLIFGGSVVMYLWDQRRERGGISR